MGRRRVVSAGPAELAEAAERPQLGAPHWPDRADPQGPGLIVGRGTKRGGSSASLGREFVKIWIGPPKNGPQTHKGSV